MLLSQKIAAKVDLLKCDYYPSLLQVVRLKIVKAPKLLVPLDIMDFTHPNDLFFNKPAGDNWGSLTANLDVEKNKFSLKNVLRLPESVIENTFRLPFKTFVVELPFGICLFEEHSEKQLSYTFIDKNGVWSGIHFQPAVMKRDQCLGFSGQVSWDAAGLRKKKDFYRAYPQLLEQELLVSCTGPFLAAVKAVLMFSSANVFVHPYVPTKAENAAVPKPLHKHYDYMVLDVAREKEGYSSLSEIEHWMASREDKRGIHSGTFKERSGGLFYHYRRTVPTI